MFTDVVGGKCGGKRSPWTLASVACMHGLRDLAGHWLARPQIDKLSRPAIALLVFEAADRTMGEAGGNDKLVWVAAAAARTT